MDAVKEKLVSWLFNTEAVRVCPPDKPFWYTSGTIGPYYINTHFLYGSEKKANQLLDLINLNKGAKIECPGKILEASISNYKIDPIYKGLIDEIMHFISENMTLNEIDCISGGERRDWFFSLILAQLLDKPHLTIYKDLSTVISYKGKTETIENLEGKNILHIADLITEASSYARAWIPAINSLKARMKWSIVVVDRLQGGKKVLEGSNIKPFSMIDVDSSLFDTALSKGLINKEQHSLLIEYLKDPRGSMRSFLIENPKFIEASLNSDERTKERAKLCLENDYYSLA